MINEMVKNIKDEISVKWFFLFDDLVFLFCSVNIFFSDSKYEFNYMRGIFIFISYFDEILYVSGWMMVRN